MRIQCAIACAAAALAAHPPTKLPPLSAALKDGVGISDTQWEAWLALYYGKLLLIARAAETAERGPNYEPTDDARTAQAAHLVRLKAMERYPGCTFTSADSLAKFVLGGAILDLLESGASGIWNVTNSGQTNWHEFAVATLDEFGLKPVISAISSAEWAQKKPTAAIRPGYSVLDLTATEKQIKRPMRPWREALKDFRAGVEAHGF